MYVYVDMYVYVSLYVSGVNSVMLKKKGKEWYVLKWVAYQKSSNIPYLEDD